MKFNILRKMTLDLTLDSSEAVMFNQGGKHKLSFDPSIFDDVNEIEISIQMQRNQQGRFDFIDRAAEEACMRRAENEN